jgi:hypothetical protein
MIEKIISGGQTGVDMAALDIAIMFGIPHGGWCPKGRIQEKGSTIPQEYKLTEITGNFKTEKENYNARTKKNIETADGTLIFIPKIPLPSQIKDGTLLTIKEAEYQAKLLHKAKPLLINLSSDSSENIQIISNWIKKEKIKTLNIAGPRESTCPGIYQLTTQFLKNFFMRGQVFNLEF